MAAVINVLGIFQGIESPQSELKIGDNEKGKRVRSTTFNLLRRWDRKEERDGVEQ